MLKSLSWSWIKTNTTKIPRFYWHTFAKMEHSDSLSVWRKIYAIFNVHYCSLTACILDFEAFRQSAFQVSLGLGLVNQSINQSINQFNSNLAARELDSKWYAVEIIDKNSKRNKQCAYMYVGAGRDVWSGLGVTMLVGNGVGQSLWVNSTFWCASWVLARKWWVLA